MYRAVAWQARNQGVSLEDEAALVAMVDRDPTVLGPGGRSIVGDSLEAWIRTAEAGEAASRVALHAGLRKRLVAMQRSLAREPGLVMEGRDIGTVVFPDADLKIYVTATPEARAESRFLELQGQGQTADPVAILGQIRQRDRQRSDGRTSSPSL